MRKRDRTGMGGGRGRWVDGEKERTNIKGPGEER